jgi:hypothetical protein
VTHLLQLRDLCSATRGDPFIPGPDPESLRKCKLHDLVFKWRFDQLAEQVEKLLGQRLYRGTLADFDNGQSQPSEVAVGTSYTNGSGLIDLYMSAPMLLRQSDAPMIGIQLQGNMLRFVVRNVAAEVASKVLRSTKADSLVNSVSARIKTIPRSRAERQLNHFGSQFHYRYAVVEKIGFEEVASLLIHCLDGLYEVADQCKVVN